MACYRDSFTFLNTLRLRRFGGIYRSHLQDLALSYERSKEKSDM
jgi:hypothetical protein